MPSSWLGYVSVLMVALGSLGIGAMFKAWLDYRYKDRKQTDDMATIIVASTNERLRTSERHGRICEANLTFMRHRHNNLSGSYDSLLLMFEVAPEKITDLIPRLREQRKDQLANEAKERAALMAGALEEHKTFEELLKGAIE